MRASHIALLSLAASTVAPVFAAPLPYYARFKDGGAALSARDCSGGNSPQPNGNTPQPNSNTPPFDSNTPPSDSNTPPSDSNTPPSDSNTPPSDSNTPPSDSNTPPSVSNTPPWAPSDSNTPPSVSNTPPSDSNTPPSDNNTPPSVSNTPPWAPSDSNTPPSVSNTPPSHSNTPPSYSNTPPSHSGNPDEIFDRDFVDNYITAITNMKTRRSDVGRGTHARSSSDNAFGVVERDVPRDGTPELLTARDDAEDLTNASRRGVEPDTRSYLEDFVGMLNSRRDYTFDDFLDNYMLNHGTREPSPEQETQARDIPDSPKIVARDGSATREFIKALYNTRDSSKRELTAEDVLSLASLASRALDDLD